MQQLVNIFVENLGLHADSLSATQMMLRTVVVYFVALALVRVGEKRFLGKNTAFDVILGVMLGSLVSRAITTASAFHQIFAAGIVFVSLHWLMAVIAFHSDRLGTFFKGHERKLIDDGRIDWHAMRKSHISKNDLLGALRRNGNLDEPEQVKRAILERSGDISVLKKDHEPRIVEVAVASGVQMVRIRLE
jgi:uncharacterized membrane protein YcaP (DUF421 family)